MTLDEAIIHAEEVVKDYERIKLIKAITLEELKYAEEYRQVAEWLKELKQLREQTRWIPFTKRPMTEEEREYYREWSDVDGVMIFDCSLPEDGQEVLVSHGGYVCTDVFCKDGCYFEGMDIDDVDAWMPLPTSYEPQERE